MIFNEKILDFIENESKSMQWAVRVALMLIIFGIGFSLFIKPCIEERNRRTTQEISQRQAFESAQLDASTLEANRRQISQLKAQYRHFLKQIPLKSDMPSVVDSLATASTASGLIVDAFVPGVEIQHDFYIECPVQILLTGQYHQLVSFLSQLVNMERILTLHDVVIEASSIENLTHSSTEPLVMKVGAIIYRQRMP